jgi:hypothetical protein
MNKITIEATEKSEDTKEYVVTTDTHRFLFEVLSKNGDKYIQPNVHWSKVPHLVTELIHLIIKES